MGNSAEEKALSYLNRLIDYSSPTVGTSAIYLAIKPQVELLCRIWLALPGNGNPLASADPAQMMKDLIDFGTISGPEQMAEAVVALNNAFSVYLTGGRRSFVQLVGPETVTTPDIMKLFTERHAQEVTEQNNLIARANDLKAKLLAVANGLAITLVAPAPTVPEKPKQVNFIIRLLSVPDESAKEANPVVVLGWTTPPILNADFDDEIGILMRIWGFLNGESKIEAEVVKNSLKNSYGLDEDKLKSMFSMLLDVFNRQIEQSRSIMILVEKDYKLYQGCLQAALELQMVLVDIGKFFNFSVETAKTPPPQKK